MVLNEKLLEAMGDDVTQEQPTDTEILSNPDYAQLAKNALLLTLAASWDDFADLAPLFNVARGDVPHTAKAKDQLRARNDRIVARLYGLTPDELAHLLRSFKVMANKRPEYLALLQQRLARPSRPTVPRAEPARPG